MPCYDPPDRGAPLMNTGKTREEYYREFEHNSPLAEAMCSILRQLTADPIVLTASGVELSPYLQAWWDTHKARDAKRIAAETAAMDKKKRANEALNKLTPEERKLLGLPRKV